MSPLDIRDDLSEEEFVTEYVAEKKPVVMSNIPYEANKWTPQALKESIGELTTQVYGTLFDLENVSTLEEYMEDNFGNNDDPMPTDASYVRWYNQLKNVDFVWGDEAFEELSSIWQKPACVPANGLIIPVTGNGKSARSNQDK